VIAAGLGVKHRGGGVFTVADFLTRRAAVAAVTTRRVESVEHPGTTVTPWPEQLGNVVLLNQMSGGIDLRLQRRALVAEGMSPDDALTEVMKRYRAGMYDPPVDQYEIPKERLDSA
jgi:hypothetical protein